jgi:coenzyme F420-reducing hydrogenase alpha subunit
MLIPKEENAMSKQPVEAQEQLFQAALQVFQAANETIFNTALTTAGFVSYLQEQTQSQLKELLQQSEKVRKANLDKIETFIKDTRELNHNFQKNVQELVKSSYSQFAPFFAATKDQ